MRPKDILIDGKNHVSGAAMKVTRALCLGGWTAATGTIGTIVTDRGWHTSHSHAIKGVTNQVRTYRTLELRPSLRLSAPAVDPLAPP